ncbi:hypothetical protein ACFFTN_04915 [Aminobacter aganoensis]|uniref:Uncharacterized protein n=1 Tax=Aminobacter aganoensis TaxID=83264 RepID=A0A7X0KJQ6_9HYPH|nr:MULTISPECIES: hypothetical protein [Aminobacter]KQU65638.1 hypothetical protein ASC75_10465 [Aminobacter sp. DSM 101952]MBB6353325.1 hypothetical protein [Aminobacter aganoensis]
MNRDDLATMLSQQPTAKALDKPWGLVAAGRPLSVKTPLRAASNTKTFVAACYSPASGIAVADFATNREARGALVSIVEQVLAEA